MKTNAILLLFFLFASCVHPKIDEPDLNPHEITLLGKWHEYGPKSPFLDHAGNVIDSIDINATYEFRPDFSYVSENDIYTGGNEGTWSYDSLYSRVDLYPVVIDIVGQSNHHWYIINLTADTLNVFHVYDLTIPNHVTTIQDTRNFVRI